MTCTRTAAVAGFGQGWYSNDFSANENINAGKSSQRSHYPDRTFVHEQTRKHNHTQQTMWKRRDKGNWGRKGRRGGREGAL